MNADLLSFRLECGPEQVFYIPDFVTEEEESYLLHKINCAPKPKWKNLSNRRLQVWGGEVTSAKCLIPQSLPPFLTEFPDIIGRLRATGIFASSKHQEPNHVIVNEYLSGQGIMPHEDGPLYHPVVGTISLGSHTIFNYYRYKAHDSMPESQASTSPPVDGLQAAPGGRAIDPKPVASILLEPRSLIITTSALYRDYLHGIEALSEDIILPKDSGPHEQAERGVCVANWKQLGSDEARQVATYGGTLERRTRISLTCRDVERVLGAKGYRRS